MSIEKSSPSPSTKAVAGADTHGKKAGKAPDGSAGSGFSAVMNMLSAAEDVAVVPPADTLLAEVPLAGQAVAQPEADVPADSAGLLALVLPAAPLVPTVESDLATATSLASASVSASMPAAALPSVAIPSPVTSPPVLSAAPTLVAATAAADPAANAATPLTPAEMPATDLAQGLAQALTAPGTEPARPLVDPKGLSDIHPGEVRPPKAADTAAQQMVALRHAAIAAAGEGNGVASNAPDMSQVSPVSALLAHRGVMQAHGVQVAQQDLKATRAAAASQLTTAVADVLTTAMAGVSGEMVQSQGRFGSRPGFGQSGSSGFESAFGQAMAATHRSDAVFEVPPPSAVVADTAVAETVSYWASQGVQTAELELEGFGDSPVEVSIVLNGDQAQIDFRTDQAGVRQVLEAATAQLRELLSTQGLQLAGVSVGTSGKGSEQGGDRRSRQGAQQATLVKTEAVGAASARMANPAVGQSLDLFV